MVSSGTIEVNNTMDLKIKGYSSNYNSVTHTTTGLYIISDDQQDPYINISGVENGGVYLGAVTPVISANV